MQRQRQTYQPRERLEDYAGSIDKPTVGTANSDSGRKRLEDLSPQELSDIAEIDYERHVMDLARPEEEATKPMKYEITRELISSGYSRVKNLARNFGSSLARTYLIPTYNRVNGKSLLEDENLNFFVAEFTHLLAGFVVGTGFGVICSRLYGPGTETKGMIAISALSLIPTVSNGLSLGYELSKKGVMGIKNYLQKSPERIKATIEQAEERVIKRKKEKIDEGMKTLEESLRELRKGKGE